MGKFERKARRRAEQQGAVDFEDRPGKLMLQVKVEYPQDGEGPPIYHTVLDCNGTELIQATSILAVDFVKALAANNDEHTDRGVELAVFLAQVQMGAAQHLAGD